MDNRHNNSGRKSGDVPDLLTKEEMDRLLSTVSSDLYYLTLYKFLKFTGRRIGEVYGTYRKGKLVGGVRLKDIDMKNRLIKTQILKTKKQKTTRECKCGRKSTNANDVFCNVCGNKLEEIDKDKIKKVTAVDKFVPMSDKLYDALNLFINNHNPKFKDNDFIFRDKSLKCIQNNIKKHIKEAGINKKFSLHGFRHYFVSNLIKNNVSEQKIISWTGHTDTSSLKAYNQLVPEDVATQINEINL